MLNFWLRRLVPAALVVSVAVAAAGARGQQPTTIPADYVAGELLVRFRPDATPARRTAVLAANRAQRIRNFDELDLDHVRLPAGMTVAAALAAFRAHPDVAAVQPNYIRHIDASTPPNDPLWLDGTLWGLQKIMAQPAWTNFTSGDGTVVVADIDTGVNYNHPDLAANMWRNPGEIPGNGIDDDGDGFVDDVFGIDVVNDDSDPMDDHGHGTHTAGTIGAIGNNSLGVVGVAWNVKLLACKFLDSTGNGSDAGAIACFNYIVKLKNRGVKIRVSSNSWGGPRGTQFPQLMQNAIDAAGNAGILNVFAAGNSGTNNDTAPFDPASIPSASIVSVAASDGSDARASFSNYGATSVDLAAPGVSIVSTDIGGGYSTKSGTSMATPHVAGAAALLFMQKPTLLPAGVKSLLLGNVDQSGSWTGLVASGGRLNVYGAALATLGDRPPTVSLTAPANGAQLSAGTTVTISADAHDSDGDATIARVDFYANGTLIGSDTSAPYSISWNAIIGSYALTAVVTDNVGATGTSVVTVTVTSASGAGANAAFVGLDTTTAGTWKSSYGADGYLVVNDATSLPAYAQVTPSGASSYTWAASTSDPRALQKAASTDRVAATWYGSTFAVDVNITDGAPHRLALYAVDWDSRGRSETVELRDAGTNALLDTRTLSGFVGGQYLTWNVQGHLTVKVIQTGGPNAVVSGLFFGPMGTAESAASAAFVGLDTTTAGTWKGTYGADGYVVVNDTTSLPAYAQVTPSGASSYTWAASTSDGRALQKAASTDRVAATWYGSTFTVDVNITDGAPHRLALYAVDWDSGGRSETVEVRDAGTNTLLDTRTLSGFVGGQYLTWNVQGHVTVKMIRTGGANAVVSGLFFEPAGNAAPSATFVGLDTTTAGTWKGTYGADGYVVVNDTTSLPGYAQVTPSGASSYTWAASTSDGRALQKAASTDRVAATWYGSTFTVDVNMTDGAPHRLALYAVDWDSRGRSETVELRDAGTNALLDTRTLSGFVGGQYLAWNVQGHITVKVIQTGGPNGVVSGLFFDIKR